MVKLNTTLEVADHMMMVLEEAFKEVLSEIAEIYKEHIDTDVYKAGTQTNYYAYGDSQPTFGLRNSVKTGVTKRTRYFITGGIYHDEADMILDPDNFIHGSNYSTKGNDIRSVLPQIINDGLSGNFFGTGWWQRPRPFITNTLIELEQSGMIKEIFAKVLKKMGIRIV